jgi:hypothetical protein
MKVMKAAGGDGLAAVGRINGSGKNLGAITIAGDLGDLECGSGAAGDHFGFVSHSIGSF